MGKPTRPSESITYEQAVAYESSRVKWYNICGYVTNIKELCDEVFHIPHVTVVKRLQAGWPLEAAFIADKDQCWSKANVSFLQAQPSTKTKFELMVKSHFAPKETKSKNGKKGA